MLATILGAFFFGFTIPVSNVVNAAPLQTIVPTWTDTVGVTVDGNSITKDASTGWVMAGLLLRIFYR